MNARSRVLVPPLPKMPSGLIELMDGLARDVLKNNPENIYEFCARHMETLLQMRDGRALRPVKTLSEKIEIAQRKVKERAEERQRAYDNKNMDSISKQTSAAYTTSNSFSDKLEENEKANVCADNDGIKEVLSIKQKEVIEKNEPNLNKDSGENEKKSLIIEDTFLVEPTTNDKGTNDSDKNGLLKETHEETKTGNNNTTDALPNETLKLPSHNNIEEKKKLSEEIDINLHNEDKEIITNDSTTEVKTDSIDKKHSTGTIETVVLLSDGNSHLGMNIDQFNKNIDASSVDKNDVNMTLDGEIKNNLTKSSDRSRDSEVLIVLQNFEEPEITSLQNSEPTPVQIIGLDSVQVTVPEPVSNEVNKETIQNIDAETTSKLSHSDKTNNVNNSMDLETAAITIQKVFRTFLFKTKTASYDDSTTVDINSLTEEKEKDENEVLVVKDRRPMGLSRMDTVLQTVNEEKSLSLSTDDSSTLSSAATIIQAHVRGFLVRNKLNSNKTISSNSLIDSDATSIRSLEADSDNIKSKTVLNIHIVPEGGHFVSRDESILTSMDLSLDSSPPSSVNLHPLGYDKSERRKQLKREDAIQSVSPPSNNSGKLSEDHDSVKEVIVANIDGMRQQSSGDQPPTENEEKVLVENNSIIENTTVDGASDEMDVITPFVEDRSSRESNNSTKLLHSGEFHDIVVPTNVTRSDTSVVRGE